jgi:Flp pilus assembly protein TadD
MRYRKSAIAKTKASPSLPNRISPAALAGLALVLVSTVVVYWSVRTQPFFVVDDDINVYNNPALTRPGGPDYAFFWHHPYFRLCTPVMYGFWGWLGQATALPKPVSTPIGTKTHFDSKAFHTAGVLLHLVCIVFVFALLRAILSGLKNRDLASVCGAGLFGLHPVQVESVAWVTGMNNVLAGLFVVLALWLYLGSVRAGRREKSIGFYLGATVAFFLGLCSKPTAVIAPIMALTLELWIVRRPLKTALPKLIPWFALSILAIAVTQMAQAGETKVAATALWLRPFLASDALTFYCVKIVWPAALGFDYGRSPDFIRTHTLWYLAWIFPVVVTAILIWLKRTSYLWLVAGALFLAALLPVIGFVPHYFHAVSLVADRYLYCAMLGPALALAFALTIAPRPLAGIAAPILLVLAIITFRQAACWRNPADLFAHSVTVSPSGWFARSNLSTAMERAGKSAEALQYAQEAARIKPDYFKNRLNLGLILLGKERFAEAAVELHAADSLEPKQQEALYNLGIAFEKSGDHSGAIAAWKEILRRQPDYAAARDALALVLLTPARKRYAEGAALGKQGKLPEAIAALREAIRLDSTLADAHADLAVALFMAGQREAAIIELKETLRLDPNNVNARQNLAKLTAQ